MASRCREGDCRRIDNSRLAHFIGTEQFIVHMCSKLIKGRGAAGQGGGGALRPVVLSSAAWGGILSSSLSTGYIIHPEHPPSSRQLCLTTPKQNLTEDTQHWQFYSIFSTFKERLRVSALRKGRRWRRRGRRWSEDTDRAGTGQNTLGYPHVVPGVLCFPISVTQSSVYPVLSWQIWVMFIFYSINT